VKAFWLSTLRKENNGVNKENGGLSNGLGWDKDGSGRVPPEQSVINELILLTEHICDSLFVNFSF